MTDPWRRLGEVAEDVLQRQVYPTIAQQIEAVAQAVSAAENDDIRHSLEAAAETLKTLEFIREVAR